MSGVLFSKVTMTTDVCNHLEPNRPLFQSGWLAWVSPSPIRKGREYLRLMRLQKEANLTGYRNAWCSSALDLGIFSIFWKLANLEVGGVGNFTGKYFKYRAKMPVSSDQNSGKSIQFVWMIILGLNDPAMICSILLRPSSLLRHATYCILFALRSPSEILFLWCFVGISTWAWEKRSWWPVFLSGWSLEIISMTFAVFQRRKAVISVFYHSLELEKPTRYLSQVGSKTSLTFLSFMRG